MTTKSKRTITISLRVTPDEHALITSGAETHDLSMTSYLVAAATGTLGTNLVDVAAQIADIQKRLAKLETIARR